MELNKCMGCMADFRGYPCPACGYDPAKEQKGAFILQPGTILGGKFLVGKVLGQGGFGITYLGLDMTLERKVAIKEYYPSGQVSRMPGTRSLVWSESQQAVSARQEGMELFLKEARKMAKLEDIPGVVKVREVFLENETAYIVMDFVEGQTLKDILKGSGPLPWEKAKDIFRPAIQSMEKVHKAGLVHRDLSPDNLMITPEGSVKILDLGAAKDLSVNSGASSMQVAKGGFSPFEQYTQRGGSGPWTDVYAMAATIYYTLTGIIPPVAIDRIAEDTIRWDYPGLQSLPAPALEALKKGMAIMAKQRTQTMAQLEQGLFAEVKQPDPKPQPKPEPPKPQPPKPEPIKPEPMPKKPLPKWLLPAVAAVVVLVIGIGIWGMKPSTKDVMTVAAGDSHTVGLRSDGTVVAKGWNEYGQCDVGDWTDIVAVAAGGTHTVGLCSDGTVVATGRKYDGRCDVSGWRNIVAVAAGDAHTVGLRSDGTVVATGLNDEGQCDVSLWRDIVAVAAGRLHTVGLRSDGTVVATGLNDEGQCDVSLWRDIVAVAVGNLHTVGLRSDGTVVATGNNDDAQCDVRGWRDIVAVDGGYKHTVGLRSDGSVVVTGDNEYGQCDVSLWKDIVAVSAGGYHTVGLRNDGTVVAVGRNNQGECNVRGW